jgi:hypothetical protein
VEPLGIRAVPEAADAAAILAIVVPAAVSLLVALASLWRGYVESKAARELERHSRIEARAEDASRRILDLLDEVRDLFKGVHDVSRGRIEQDAVYELCHRIDREIILIPDESLRERLQKITMALWHIETSAVAKGHSLQQVAFFLYRAGHSLIGAFLRGEDLPPKDSSVQLSSLEDYYSAATELEAEVERRMKMPDS